MRCSDCKFFDTGDDSGSGEWPGSGRCTRWHQSYGDDPSEMKPNDCWVESDEGWCNMVGPEFGCVLFETKTSTQT